MINNAEDMVAALRDENERLRRRVAELEQKHDIQRTGLEEACPLLEVTAPENWRSWELFQQIIDHIPDPIFAKDLHHRWIACNQGFCELIGYDYEAIIGYSDPDRWPKEQADIFWAMDDAVFASGQPNFNEELATGTDSVTRTIWTRKFPMHNMAGQVIGLCGIITDVTAIKQLEAEQIIRAQREVLRELSAPLIPVADDVVIMPLIGTIDSLRAQQVMEALLQGVERYQAETVILDITGIQIVDTQVASTFIQAAQAVRLLGAQVMMTGIQPQMAQTLVQLGIDLRNIITYSSLQAGIAAVLHRH